MTAGREVRQLLDQAAADDDSTVAEKEAVPGQKRPLNRPAGKYVRVGASAAAMLTTARASAARLPPG
jgi:hypothetical protein